MPRRFSGARRGASGALVQTREGWAKAVSCVRLDTPSLLKDRYKCAPTVRGDTNRRAAISGLVRPSAASKTTCRSEGDRLDSASAGEEAERSPAARCSWDAAPSPGGT